MSGDVTGRLSSGLAGDCQGIIGLFLDIFVHPVPVPRPFSAPILRRTIRG
jgi:hypothetical protein